MKAIKIACAANFVLDQRKRKLHIIGIAISVPER